MSLCPLKTATLALIFKCRSKNDKNEKVDSSELEHTIFLKFLVII
jgi:hypothetical protein